MVASSFCDDKKSALSLLVRGISEDKQTRNLVSFDPANFEMSEISREFLVLMPFGTVVSSYLRSHFTEKEL